jgi:MFS transporter, FSR family, fosmidomycin resistance protein
LGGFSTQAAWLALVYNALAFGLQPVAGWLADRSRRYRELLLAGLASSAAALLLFGLAPALAIGLAGLGSAALHTAGGGLAIQATPGKAAGPGWFAAPGVLGLAIGGLLATQAVDPTWPLVLALAGCGLLAAALCPKRSALLAQLDHRLAGTSASELIIVLLILALALRSTLWTGLQLQAGSQASPFLWLALVAALGKALGGMLSDWLECQRWMPVALVLAALLLTLGASGGPGNLAFLAGVFFLQSITPALLAALGVALPGRPALAASLGLGSAVILGSLPALAGWSSLLDSPVAVLLVLASIGVLAWHGISAQRSVSG